MLDARHQVGANDIAIVGMALRVPGAADVEQFWANLRNGVESIRDLSQEELLASGEDPARLADPNYIARTADLEGMEMFDAEFFGLSPKDAAIMDPQHRQFLECAWEALENAGKVPGKGQDQVGIFAGCGMGSYFYFNVCSNKQLVDQVGMFLLRHTGNDKDFLATRASFLFDLRGPSVNIQTACSTSLVAVHYAVQSLLSGECDLALAGGVTVEFPHRRGYMYHPGEILSPDGRCRPFDHRAAGTVFGSGVGVVALRRVSDALRDGDVIHAVIKGTAINNDGSSKAGYLAPSVSGQAEAVVEAQTIADVAAETIQYVECHGTGTYLGDPIEIEALSHAFRQSTSDTEFCYVGSVKSNIGHLDTAAGVVGLIKTSLAIKHGEIPPTLGFERPNPAIDFANTPFKVCDRLVPWPTASGPRRASINSLGVGGTNAHVILEEAPVPYRHDAAEGSAAAAPDEPLLLLLSGRSRAAVIEGGARLKSWMQEHEHVRLQDVAHTLFTGRRRFDEWMIVPVRGRSGALDALSDGSRAAGFQTRLPAVGAAVFMFPGGGTQYAGMGLRLYREDKAFRASVDQGLSYLDGGASSEVRRAWLEADGQQDAENLFLRPSVQLPAILILEIALARLWMARGVRPKALIGHSMGEYAAACLSGVMSFADAVRLVRLRGELFETVEPSGMLSVPVEEARVRDLLPASLDLACINAPSMCVVSGQVQDLENFQAFLLEQDIEAKRIPINIAAHSRLLDGILERFGPFVGGLSLKAPRIPIISNRTGLPLTDNEATDPAYWTEHLRQAVRFADGLSHLAQDASVIYIEVGPGRVLSSLAKAHGKISPPQIINSLPHGEEAADDRLHFLLALGKAFTAGLEPDIADLVQAPSARLVSLPSYAFQHKRYFIEPSRREVVGEGPPELHKEPEIDKWGYQPVWKRSLCAYDSALEAEPRTWLFFLDEDGIGEALVQRLRSKNHRVVTVSRGDGFRRGSPDAYSLCPELGKEEYEALLAGLKADDVQPAHIVHLWLADRQPHLRPGSTAAHQFQEWGFDCLVGLGQAMAQAGVEEATTVTVVTSKTVQVERGETVVPEKALVLGPVLVIPKEMPTMSIRLVDIENASVVPEKKRFIPEWGRTKAPLADSNRAQLDSLWEEINAPAACEVAALRGGRRWQQTSAALPLVPQEAPAAGFRPNGVYMLVGGLSGVAMALALELAAKYAARLVLVSRLTLPPEEQWDDPASIFFNKRMRHAVVAIRRLKQAGAEVLHVTADITDVEAMTAAASAAIRRFGHINGVFHCAGSLDDGLLVSKTPQSMERVLSAKVTGTRVLDVALKDVALDFVALFSSTSTDVPRAGQVDYVAANAFLNAYAQTAAGGGADGRKVLAIHWGVWDEVGLAARAVGLTEPEAGSPSNPVFDRVVDDEQDEAPVLEIVLDAERQWMLNEHRLVSGMAVLPGTAYVDLLVQAAVETGLGMRSGTGVTVRDLSFIRPSMVEEGERRVLRFRFQQRSDGVHVTVLSRSERSGEDVELVHAKALLAAARPQSSPRKADLEAIRERCSDLREAEEGGALASVQEADLRFGKRWQVLRTMGLGDGEAIADLRLADAHVADLAHHPLHPALLDIATGFALELSPEYRATGSLWVPAGYGEITVHAPLTQHIVSWARLVQNPELTEDFASFDVTIAAPDGTVLVEVQGFAMCRARGAFETEASAIPGSVDAIRSTAQPVSPAMQRLQKQVRNGIRPREGLEALERALSFAQPEIVISSISLPSLRDFVSRTDEKAARTVEGFERPDLGTEFLAPRTPVEETLAGFWRELLGVEQVGIDDDFFDLGGHSLMAVRLFRMIKGQWNVDLPISTLFEAPTIARCAERITPHIEPVEAPSSGSAERTPARSPREAVHLVMINPGPPEGATPIFICAGMFGNILNLRHLAMTLGVDRPVYGLQARGLYGDHEPHRRFEDMARDCLAEMRQVQPQGPYLLAGYSGGGLTAMEIAHQLETAGETVAHLSLLDTPLPRQPGLTLVDRAVMKYQDISRHKARYLRKWLGDHRNTKIDNKIKHAAMAGGGPVEGFDNVRIEIAFRDAAAAYQVKPCSVPVTLFRPRPVVFYRLPRGRSLQENRNILLHDNGWGRYAETLEVIEVPGDHDTMVLDPNVRVLAKRLRARLQAASPGKALPQVERGVASERPQKQETMRELAPTA
jgi:acyl transferase domain-containing protein/thioesterase domain-containing protein